MYLAKWLRPWDKTLSFSECLLFWAGVVFHFGWAGKNQAGPKKKNVGVDGLALLAALHFRGEVLLSPLQIRKGVQVESC